MTTHTLDIIYYAIHWLSMACFLVVVAFVIVTAIKIWARSAPKAGGVLHHVPTVWTLRSLFESANSVQRGVHRSGRLLRAGAAAGQHRWPALAPEVLVARLHGPLRSRALAGGSVIMDQLLDTIFMGLLPFASLGALILLAGVSRRRRRYKAEANLRKRGPK